MVPEHKAVRERLLDGAAALSLHVTVSSLTADLKRGDPGSRRIAAKRLGWFGTSAAEAVPALIVLLGDVGVREEVVQTLRKIGPEAKAAIPGLGGDGEREFHRRPHKGCVEGNKGLLTEVWV